MVEPAAALVGRVSWLARPGRGREMQNGQAGSWLPAWPFCANRPTDPARSAFLSQHILQFLGRMIPPVRIVLLQQAAQQRFFFRPEVVEQVFPF